MASLITNNASKINQYHRFNNKKTNLELKSVNLIASQEFNLYSKFSKFDRIFSESPSKNPTSESILIDDIAKNSLNTKQLVLPDKNNAPSYLLKKEILLKKQTLQKPKKSQANPVSKMDKKIVDQDKNIVVMSQDKLKFKSLEIDLKKNEVNKIEPIEKASDNDITIRTTSESIDSKSNSKLEDNKLAKSFLEKFFDREPLSEEDSITLKNESTNELNKKENNNQDENISEDTIKENVQNFIEKLFNYTPNKTITESTIDEKNSKIETFDEKLNFLNNFKSKDSKIIKTIRSYSKAYEILSDSKVDYFLNKRIGCKCIQNNLKCCLKIKSIEKCCQECRDYREGGFIEIDLKQDGFENLLETSNLLSNNEFYRFLKKFKSNNSESDCNCHLKKNKFKCCIEIIYGNLVKNDFKDLDEQFLMLECCSKCSKEVKPNTEVKLDNKLVLQSQESIEDELLETSDLDIKRIAFVRKSLQESFNEFFKAAEKFTEAQNEAQDILTESQKSSKIFKKPIQSITPRKTIIKNVKTNPSKTRKSVTFLEDPKYGFSVVEVPDWLEHLRDPVYSTKLKKPRDEWKN
ncbi:unnamed protein product [Brachionus calyciflorus]|uniref:Uncharacterized protein n=1 Tax=Brachionus calyciflorus TaxID=104777 RepID=A0A813M1X4_9BILA|nr:unnamed protein product [Brachionus calyciflorus]